MELDDDFALQFSLKDKLTTDLVAASPVVAISVAAGPVAAGPVADRPIVSDRPIVANRLDVADRPVVADLGTVNPVVADNRVLYSTIEVFQTQELPKRISERDANDIVFASQFTLQLCEIAIGSSTVVATKNEVVVKTAWPTNDKSLTSVSLTRHGKALGV
ncbi:uncharacterized protein [Temnothorax nylanderi]|uniref:uncharacterized protein n=1 Tax=Temnothorax nylanderi TaxID=102681 RepID=UPI003A8BE6B8